MTYYLDANIVSYLLKGNKDIFSKLSDLASNDHTISIPNIVYYEIKRGLLANGATTKLNRFINFAKVLGIVELKTSTLDIAAQIYADLKNDGNIIEDDDIFIGATALENDAILVTNNERHLGRIKDLKYEVWS